jgi:hypothetical protein
VLRRTLKIFGVESDNSPTNGHDDPAEMTRFFSPFFTTGVPHKMYQICHYLKSFKNFLIKNKFAHDALNGYRCVSVDFRDAYHQALLDDSIFKQESKDEAYEVSHLPSTHSHLRGLPPVNQQGMEKASDNY